MKYPLLGEFTAYLEGCRFCPMCKPAGEVANLTFLESHTTKSRAMMLWSAVSMDRDLSPREAELLFQSTLDSISEAWCVSHYPVSSYVAAARADVFAAGAAPQAVEEAAASAFAEFEVDAGSLARAPTTVFIASEIMAGGEPSQMAVAGDILRAEDAPHLPVPLPSGAVAFALGDRDTALRQAQAVASVLTKHRKARIITDGPETLWALTRLYPQLGVSVNTDSSPLTLVQHVSDRVRNAKPVLPSLGGRKVFVVDSRCCALLANTLADSRAILPEFAGPEEALGTGRVYEESRLLLREMGATVLQTRWERALSRSSGADDGLWLSYPHLARRLAVQTLDDARSAHAEIVVSDSPLVAAHLARHSQDDVHVAWLPELLSAEGQGRLDS